MATTVLAILIFGTAGSIVYSTIKKGKNCGECHTTCPVKKETSR